MISHPRQELIIIMKDITFLSMYSVLEIVYCRKIFIDVILQKISPNIRNDFAGHRDWQHHMLTRASGTILVVVLHVDAALSKVYSKHFKY